VSVGAGAKKGAQAAGRRRRGASLGKRARRPRGTEGTVAAPDVARSLNHERQLMIAQRERRGGGANALGPLLLLLLPPPC
jgi:hypothetical protein